MAVGVGGRVVTATGGVLQHLGKDPGIGGGGAADHDGVAAGLPHHALGVFRRVDVAIADDGNAHGLLDGGDEIPVGLAGVALHARARVDGDGFDADGFRELGDVNGYDGILVPAGAQLDGERDFYGGAHRAEDLLEQRHVAQQAGASALHDFLGGAAEIDVAPGLGRVFDPFFNFPPFLGVGAQKLPRDWGV